jgi:hypothetical protein
MLGGSAVVLRAVEFDGLPSLQDEMAAAGGDLSSADHLSRSARQICLACYLLLFIKSLSALDRTADSVDIGGTRFAPKPRIFGRSQLAGVFYFRVFFCYSGAV